MTQKVSQNIYRILPIFLLLYLFLFSEREPLHARENSYNDGSDHEKNSLQVGQDAAHHRKFGGLEHAKSIARSMEEGYEQETAARVVVEPGI